jgi:dCTP deaminase
MTVLSNKDIFKNLGYSVIIDPFRPENVNTSSYDVSLGENYFWEHPPEHLHPNGGGATSVEGSHRIYNIYSRDEVLRVWGSCPSRAMAASFLRDIEPGCDTAGINKDDRVILLPPGATILAHTEEFIGARINATSMMKARSSFGRNHIEVCKCAGYGDIGYFNRWTMEITNNSQFYHIPLVVGRRIAQIVFLATGDLIDKKVDYASMAISSYQDTQELEELKKNWDPMMMLPRLDRDRDIKRSQSSPSPSS